MIYVAIFLVSIFFLFFAVKFGLKYYSSKDIAIFKLIEDETIFHVPKEGYYSLGLLAGFDAENFNFTIRAEHAEEFLEIEEAFPKEMMYKNGLKGKIHYDFYVEKVGNYAFKINNINELKLWNSFKPSLTSPFSYFEKQISTDKMSIIVKEYARPLDFLLSLLLALVGVTTFCFSIILLIGKFKL